MHALNGCFYVFVIIDRDYSLKHLRKFFDVVRIQKDFVKFNEIVPCFLANGFQFVAENLFERFSHSLRKFPMLSRRNVIQKSD